MAAMWNRIVLGLLGLLITFSAGAQLQLWWDKGIIVWHRKGAFPSVMDYDVHPVAFDAILVGLVAGLVGGLCLVWIALGGKFGRKT